MSCLNELFRNSFIQHPSPPPSSPRRLLHPWPANYIGDTGTRDLAEGLASNRGLRKLVLASKRKSFRFRSIVFVDNYLCFGIFFIDLVVVVVMLLSLVAVS